MGHDLELDQAAIALVRDLEKRAATRQLRAALLGLAAGVGAAARIAIPVHGGASLVMLAAIAAWAAGELTLAHLLQRRAARELQRGLLQR